MNGLNLEGGAEQRQLGRLCARRTSACAWSRGVTFRGLAASGRPGYALPLRCAPPGRRNLEMDRLPQLLAPCAAYVLCMRALEC
jgi:hypothetical protein